MSVGSGTEDATPMGRFIASPKTMGAEVAFNQDRSWPSWGGGIGGEKTQDRKVKYHK